LIDLYTSYNTIKSILNVTGSQCKGLRTDVICSYFLVLLGILAAAFCMSCNYYGLFRKASEEAITVIHPAGDKSMNNFSKSWK